MPVAMEHQDTSVRNRRAKKACTECRQQKARCDVTNGIPCTRCRKVDARCFISDPFKRENKRQKLNELEHETQELRERLEMIGGNGMRPTARSKRTHNGASMTTPPNEVENSSLISTKASMISGQTVSRAIDCLELDAAEIDDLFRLYFSHFSQYLPILDPSKSPNAYYEASCFLFWAIIGAGSRAYTRTSKLMQEIRSRVLDLAFDSLKVAPTLESIQGLLLVVTWPFPKKTGIWNPTFALLGAVLHCAMNIGLHLPSSYQEFYKFRSQLTEHDIQQRTEVWAYCVMVHQRTILCKGSSAFTLNDLCQDPKARSNIFEHLSDDTKTQLRMRDVVTRALRSFTECGLQDMTTEQDRTLKLLIRSYQTQLEEFRTHAISPTDELSFTTAYLTLQMFHLFRHELLDDMEPITNLFSAACQTIEKFDKISQLPTPSLKGVPFILVFALLNAALILLRLYKTPLFSVCIDETRAKAMVLLAISLAKKMSVQEDDLAARSVKALGDMVDSQKAYKSPSGDGMPVPLRVRSRSAMSIVLDGLIWWREEFGGTMGVYPVPLKSSADTLRSTDLPTPAIYINQANIDPTTMHDSFDSTLDSFLFGQAWMGFEDMLSPSYFGGYAGSGMDSTYLQ